MVEAGGESPRLVRFLAPSGDGNQRDCPTQRLLSNLSRHFITVELGHTDIEHGNFRQERIERPKSFPTVVRDGDIVPFKAQ